MWQIIKGVVVSIATALGIIRRAQEDAHDAEQQKTGAIKQENADAEGTIEAQREQLDTAANARPGDSLDSLRKHDF